MQKIITTLSRLSLFDLEEFAGRTIVKAVKSAYNTNSERELARLVIDRYGNDLIGNERIRLALVDGLSKQDALEACQLLNLKNINFKIPQETLIHRFSTPFSRDKAVDFLRVFDLDEAFLPVSIVDERKSSEKIEAIYGEVITLKGVLHPYQRHVKDTVSELLDDGYRKLMVQMPTGAGKTITALEIIVDRLRSANFQNLIIWIVDSSELAEQALISFSNLWKARGDRPVFAHRFFGDFDINFETCKSGVVFCTFAKVNASIKSRHVDRVNNINYLSKRADLIFVDEAHKSVADTYSAVVSNLIRLDAKLVGLSATPGRVDYQSNLDLSRMYGNKLVSIKNENGVEVIDAVTYLQQGEYLANIEFIDLLSEYETEEDDESKLCIELAESAIRNEQIIKQIEASVKASEPTIVYACTKDHVIALMALCRAKNIDAGFVIGEVSTVTRNKIFEQFKNGNLMVVINHEILSTGIDLPNLKKIIITRPISSPILYSQILGRALRGPKNGGTKLNYVVNILDNLVNFPSASHIYNSFRNNF